MANLRELRILIVDDDPECLLFLETALSTWGHDVRWAVDAAQALTCVQWPDVVLTDIHLVGSGQNGVELADRISAIRPNLPAVFVTATDSTAPIVRQARRRGDVVHKPIDFGALMTILARIPRTRQ